MTVKLMRQRLLLQIFIALGGTLPVGAGAAGVLLGPGFLSTTFDVAADSHFRYLSGLLLGMGLGFWSTIPRIEANSARFQFLTLVVFIGGLARLFSLAAAGIPPIGMFIALAMELAVTPLLCYWQWRFSRNFNSGESSRSDHQRR